MNTIKTLKYIFILNILLLDLSVYSKNIVSIEEIVSSENKYPFIEVKFDFYDKRGRTVPEIPKSDIEVSEDKNSISQVDINLKKISNKKAKLSIAYIIDNTEAVSKNFDKVKEIIKFVNTNLYRTDKTSLFSTENTDPLVPLNHDKEIISLKLDEMSFHNNKLLYNTIIGSVNYLAKNEESKRVIFIFSDGNDTSNKFNTDELISKANGFNIDIYSFNFNAPVSGALKRISQNTNGFYILGERADNSVLNNALNKISNEMKESYNLSYTSPVVNYISQRDLKLSVNYNNEKSSGNKKFTPQIPKNRDKGFFAVVGIIFSILVVAVFKLRKRFF